MVWSQYPSPLHTNVCLDSEPTEVWDSVSLPLSLSTMFSWEPNSGLTLDAIKKEESSRKCWFQWCDFILSRLPHWAVRPAAQDLLRVSMFVCCWECPALVWRPHDTHILLSEEETTSSCSPELWETKVSFLWNSGHCHFPELTITWFDPFLSNRNSS